METLSVGGAVFFLKTPKESVKKIPQVYYKGGDAVYVEPGSERWLQLMGRFKLSEYFVSPELWEAANNLEELRQQIFKGKDSITVGIKRDVEGYGDMLMMSVIPKAFKEAFGSKVRIIVYTKPNLAEMLNGNPFIDEVRTDVGYFTAMNFDLKLNANQIDFKSETTAEELMEGRRKNRANLFLQQLGLWLVDRTPVYKVTKEEEAWAKKEIENLKRPVVAVQLRASCKARTWPHAEELCQELQKRGYGVVKLDAEKDGRHVYSLRQMGALINQADITVSGDSLAYHLAGAMRKRAVAVFGSTEGRVFCQDYEKVRWIQGTTCHLHKSPCWWKIPCLPGNSTREKEVAGYTKCLETVPASHVADIVVEELRKKPKILALMLTWNLLNMTKKAVASIKSSYDYDLFVVDNNSTDGTQDWLKEQGIDFVSKELGVPEALNIGAGRFLSGDYDYFLYLNNDIVLRSDYIDELVMAQMRTNAWAICGKTIENTPPWAVDDAKKGDRVDKEIIDIPASAYSAIMFSRECIEKVGEWDVNFSPRYIEDNDYNLRIRLKGGKFAITQAAQFYHVLGAVVKSNEEVKRKNAEAWNKNIAYYIKKWGIHPHEHQDLKRIGLPFETPYEKLMRIQNDGKKATVAVVRMMGGVGDHIFLSVVGREIKKRIPKATVEYMCPDKFLEVYQGYPYIDKAHVRYNDPFDIRMDATDADYRQELAEMGKYGRVVTPRTKIYLDMFGLPTDDLKPDFFVSDNETRWALQEWKTDKKRVSVSLRSSNDIRSWPYMQDLVNRIKAEGKWDVKVLDERYNGSFRYRFRQGAALVSISDVVVAGNTGYMNVAGAIGVPVMGIFSHWDGTPFKRMFPSMTVLQGVGCPYREEGFCGYDAPCFDGADFRQKENRGFPICMKNLKLEDVYSKMEEIL